MVPRIVAQVQGANHVSYEWASLKGYQAYRSRQAEVASDASKRDVNQHRSAMLRKEMELKAELT